MFGLKISTDLCITKLRIETENIFVDIVCNVLVKNKYYVKHIPNCIATNGNQVVEIPKQAWTWA